MGSWSIWHWIVVLLIALVVFGTKRLRLRDAGKDLGEAVRGFKDAMRDPEEKPNGQLTSERKAESQEQSERDRAEH